MYDLFSIFFFNTATLFEVEGKLRTGTIIHDEDNFTFANLEDLADLSDIGVFQFFVSFYLTLDVSEEAGGLWAVLFDVYVVYFYGNMTILFEVIAFVNLAEATFSEQHQRQVFLVIVAIFDRLPLLSLIITIQLLEADLKFLPVYFHLLLLSFQLIFFSYHIFLDKSN